MPADVLIECGGFSREGVRVPSFVLHHGDALRLPIDGDGPDAHWRAAAVLAGQESDPSVCLHCSAANGVHVSLVPRSAWAKTCRWFRPLTARRYLAQRFGLASQEVSAALDTLSSGVPAYNKALRTGPMTSLAAPLQQRVVLAGAAQSSEVVVWASSTLGATLVESTRDWIRTSLNVRASIELRVPEQDF